MPNNRNRNKRRNRNRNNNNNQQNKNQQQNQKKSKEEEEEPLKEQQNHQQNANLCAERQRPSGQESNESAASDAASAAALSPSSSANCIHSDDTITRRDKTDNEAYKKGTEASEAGKVVSATVAPDTSPAMGAKNSKTKSNAIDGGDLSPPRKEPPPVKESQIPSGKAQGKIIIHHIVAEEGPKEEHEKPKSHQNTKGTADEASPSTATQSPSQAKVIIHHIHVEDDPETDRSTKEAARSDSDSLARRIQIQEVSDESGNEYSASYTDNPPLISEAESETDTLSGIMSPVMDIDELSLSFPLSPTPPPESPADKSRPGTVGVGDDVKQRRLQKRVALESHFLPQFLNPRYLDSISEENSDMSDARSDCSDLPMRRSTSDDPCAVEKARKANAVFPKSQLDFSKKHKQGQLPKPVTTKVPQRIREETTAVMVETKIVDSTSAAAAAEESCSRLASVQTPKSEDAELVYIDSASSSMSDLLELDTDADAADDGDGEDTTATSVSANSSRSTIDLDTDVSEIIANTRGMTAMAATEERSDGIADNRESTPVNQTSTVKQQTNETIKVKTTQNERQQQQQQRGQANIAVEYDEGTRSPKEPESAQLTHTTSKFSADSSIESDGDRDRHDDRQRQRLSSSGNSQETRDKLIGSVERERTAENDGIRSATSSSATIGGSSSGGDLSTANVETDSSDTERLLRTSSSSLFDRKNLNLCAENVRNSEELLESIEIEMENVRKMLNESVPESEVTLEKQPTSGNGNGYDYAYGNGNGNGNGDNVRILGKNAHDNEVPPPVPPPPKTDDSSYSQTTYTSVTNNNNSNNNNNNNNNHTSTITTTTTASSHRNSAFTRQESADSLCSTSTNHSQCTAIPMGAQSPRIEDFDATSPISDRPATSATDEWLASAFTGSKNQNDDRGQDIKKLRLLCTETLASMPYGDAVLEELANVAQNIGESRAAKTLEQQNPTTTDSMPYPLPSLPHIGDLQLSLQPGSSRPSGRSVAITQLPGKTEPPSATSPPPPPVPEPPSKYDSWLGVATEANPHLLVCLSPSQRSYMAEHKATQEVSNPDQLLDAHQKFVERRGYHEFSNEQVRALNEEKLEEPRILQTAGVTRKLRKSVTPPPIPPPPVPMKSSETAAKAQNQQQQQRQQQQTSTKIADQSLHDAIFRNVNEQRAGGGVSVPPFANGEDNRHRLLSILSDNRNESKHQQQTNRNVNGVNDASQSSSHENRPRQMASDGGDRCGQSGAPQMQSPAAEKTKATTSSSSSSSSAFRTETESERVIKTTESTTTKTESSTHQHHHHHPKHHQQKQQQPQPQPQQQRNIQNNFAVDGDGIGPIFSKDQTERVITHENYSSDVKFPKTASTSDRGTNMQSVESELSKMFPSLASGPKGHQRHHHHSNDIFDEQHKRFSNIETQSGGGPYCSQLLATQPKRYSNIETHSYEAKKRIENGQVVYDYSNSSHEAQRNNGDGGKFPLSPDAADVTDAPNQGEAKFAGHQAFPTKSSTTNIDEIMSALNLNEKKNLTKDQPAAAASAPAATEKQESKQQQRREEHHTDNSSAKLSRAETETETAAERQKREEIINRQVSEEIALRNKDITSSYEEFRQRAKAAAEAFTAPPPPPPATSSIPTTATTHRTSTASAFRNGDEDKTDNKANSNIKSTFHFDHDNLFKDFDDLSQQLHKELESGRARSQQRLQHDKSSSMFDLSRHPTKFTDQFAEMKKKRHEHLQELEREIERSMRSRQMKSVTREVPIEVTSDHEGGRVREVPIRLENGQNGQRHQPQRNAAHQHQHQAPPPPEGPRSYDVPIRLEPDYQVTSPLTPQHQNYPTADYEDPRRFRRAESMFDLGDNIAATAHRQRSSSHNYDAQQFTDDWSRYASDLGSSENIARPIAREVEICYQRCKPNTIRAPRLTVSTNDLSAHTTPCYDTYNAYTVRRKHAPMMHQAPPKTRPEYSSCFSMIERDPNPTYISTTSRRAISPAPQMHQATQESSQNRQPHQYSSHSDLHRSYDRATQEQRQRRSSLPREIHEQQLKYILSKEEELKTEFERLQHERRRLMEELNRVPAPTLQMPQHPMREAYRPAPSKLPTLSEDEVFRQQMAEEWLNKVAEREERRLQKIIKISKINSHEGRHVPIQMAAPQPDISEEFLKRVHERRSKLAMPADSDWESGAESQPVGPGHASESDEVPTVKIIDGKTEAELRQLPRHLREFAKFSNHQTEKIDGGEREVHQEEESRQEADGNAMSSATKKSSIVKTIKISRRPPEAGAPASRPAAAATELFANANGTTATATAPETCTSSSRAAATERDIKIETEPSTSSPPLHHYNPFNFHNRHQQYQHQQHHQQQQQKEKYSTDYKPPRPVSPLYRRPFEFDRMTPNSPHFLAKLPASVGEMFSHSPFKNDIFQEFENYWRKFESNQ